MKRASAVLLADATIQEIQLELLRRASFNAFDGERVVASLLEHRDLWEAAMMDRFCFSRLGRLPDMGLIKLRDLSDNIWNVDTLYVLTPSKAKARELASVAKKDRWGGELKVHTDQENIDAALGSGREKRAVVSIWWD